MNNYTMTSFLTSNVRHNFCKLYYCYLGLTGSLLCTGWIKTWPAQKLLVWVKFTGNLYSYVCEWPPLKYTQTRVYRNSYMGYPYSARLILVFTWMQPYVLVQVNMNVPLVRVKLLQAIKGNPDSYSYSCLCERSLKIVLLTAGTRIQGLSRFPSSSRTFKALFCLRGIHSSGKNKYLIQELSIKLRAFGYCEWHDACHYV